MVKIQNYECGIMNGLSIARPPLSVASRRLLQWTTDYRSRTPFFRFLLLFLLAQFIIHNSAFPQQPQAQAGQEIFPVNAKFVQGFGPGYWPTAGSNLSLSLAPGTAVCSNTVQTYAGGTLTLAPSATNYVYLNPANNCAPASNTSGFTTASIPIATVVTTSTAISSVTDVRTMFVSSGVTNTGTVSSVGMTGDGIIFNSAVSGSPITSSGTLAPQLLTQTAKTVLAGPGSGPAATPTFRALAATDLPASITSSTSGNAATATALGSNPTQCGSNNWATGISSGGNANCLQPGFGNLAGSLALGQTPLTTAGDILFTNVTPALARLPIGGSNQFLGISGGLPAWIQPNFSNLSGTATISQGGTGQTTAATAFNALSPLTTEGDLHYYHSSSNTRLAIGGASTFLTSNGTDPSWGSLSGVGFGSQTANCFFAAPNGSNGNMSCRAVVAADIPTLNQSTTGNAATATALATAPTQCTGSALALGIAASGNANCIGSQTANYVYAAPNGSSGAPTFRAIATGDLPGSGVTTVGGVNCTLGSSCTLTSLNGVSFPASPTTNSVPVVTSSNTITYETVPNTALANSATTVNGQTCTLGSTCSVNSGAPQYSITVNGAAGAAVGGISPSSTSGVPLISAGSSANPTFGTAAIAGGGTGQTTAAAAFNALSPLASEGDLHYYHSSSNSRLAIGGTNTFLTSNGTDPSWGSLTGAGFGSQTANNFLAAPNGTTGNPSFRTLVAADLPASITSNTSGNATTATALATAPTQCTGSAFALGVAASGNANCIGSQTANYLYAAPNGSSGTPTFRALVGSDLPTIAVSGGGTGQTTAGAAFNTLSPLSTEGDFLYYHASANTRLGIGSNGQCLTSNGSDPLWGSCGSGGVSSINGDGNLITNSSSTGAVTLTVGSFSPHYFWGNNTGTSATAVKSLIGTSDTSVNWYAAGSGSAQAQTVTLSPAATGMTAGLTVRWKPTAANTGSGPTLAVNGLTATTITKCGTTALVANDLTTANIATAVYDGTEFQLLNPMAAGCGGGGNLSTSGSPAQYQVGIFASGTALAGISPSATSGVPMISQGSSANPTFGTASIAGGGTGQTTATAAFNALSPLTTEGDLHYYHSSSNARLAIGSNGQCLTSNGTDPLWGSCSTGSGTVTSVGLSMPSMFSVSGTPVTGSGTLTAALANQNANLIMAGPSSGSATAPTFRSLVGADLPAPTSTTLGGVESLSCTTGQFLNQISTGGVPACATPSGSGSSAGLGNGTTAIDLTTVSGATFQTRVTSASTLICTTLGLSGGIINGTGLYSGYPGVSMTITSNFNLGTATCPITLLWGAYTVTESAGAGIGLYPNDQILGVNHNVSGLTGNGASAMVFQANPSANSTGLTIAHMGIYNYVNAVNGGGVPQPGDMALYLPQASSARILDNVLAASYGLFYGSYTPFRPDLGYYTQCNCDSDVENNQITGWAIGLYLGISANANTFKNNNFYGQFSGTPVYIPSGAFSNSFEGNDIEVQNLGFDIYGQDVNFEGYQYYESIGLNGNTPTWAAGYAYLAGEVISDSNGNEQKCVQGGTSGGSHPTWGTVAGSQVTDGGAIWQRVVNPTVILEPSSGEIRFGGSVATTASMSTPGTFFEQLSTFLPTVDTWAFQQARIGSFPDLISQGGQFTTGGLFDAPLTQVSAPALSYHNPAGSTHATTYYYYVNFNSLNGVTGLGSQASIANAPNILGTAQTLSFTSGMGSGYAATDTITMNVAGATTNPVITVDSVNGTGGVLTAHISNAGANVSPGLAFQLSTSGNGVEFEATLDSNYVEVCPPLLTTSRGGNFAATFGTWDIIGRANVTNTSVSTAWSPSQGLVVPGSSGCYMDLGNGTAAYSPASRNSTGDVQVGATTTGAVEANLGLNQGTLHYDPTLGFIFSANSGTGNANAGFTLMPEGTGNESSIVLCSSSTCSVGNYNSIQSFSTGLDLFGGSIITGDQYGNPHNTLDDGAGNMTVANKITAQQFCISSNCVSSLWSNPMSTLGDLLYGGASGAATRLAGNTSTTPMYLKSVGSGSTATAPALAQIQFTDIAGTLGIGAGGTGQTTASAAFNALSPLTTEGDLHYYHSSSNTRLVIGGANTFLTSNGTDPSWGSLTGAGFGSQTANTFLAAPNGSSGNPSFRTLVAADVPSSLTSNTSGNAATATALAAVPTQCSGNNFATGVAASGNANCSQPTFSNLSGSVSTSQLPTVPVLNGGTGQTTAAAAFNALSPLTTEGDLHYYHSSANARLGIGSNGQCLTSNGTDPLWGSCGSGMTNPMTTLGDLIYGAASGTPTRLAGNTSTTPMYLKSLGASGAATAPTLAQIQFSDITGTLGIGVGGTGQTTAAAAFSALSPMTTNGDIIYYSTGSAQRLGLGASTQFLWSNGSLPSWHSIAGSDFGTQTAHYWFGVNGGSTANPAFGAIGTSDTSVNWYIAGGGTAQAQTATLSPAATALTPGLIVVWKPTAANTGAGPTLAVNGLTATTITKCGTTALVSGDLSTTIPAIAIYDGTEFQLLNPVYAAVACGGTGNKSLNSYALAVTNAGTQITGLANGTSKQLLTSGGGGANPGWIDYPEVMNFPAATCNNSTAATIWALPTSSAPTVACRTGTNVQAGVLQFPQSDAAQFQVNIPGDYDSAGTVYAKIYFTQAGNTTASQTIIMQMATGCSSTTDDPSFNAAQSFGTATTTGTANTPFTETLSSVTMTGCSAGGNMNVKISRSGSDTATTSPNVYRVSITFPRLITNQAN